MNLQEQLSLKTSYYGKLNYDEIVKKLEGEAFRGELCTQIHADKVHDLDIERLKANGLQVELIYGEDYNYYYQIRW